MARVLLVGGTGYLGSLVGAALLMNTEDFVILAARPGHQSEDILARLRMQMSAAGKPVEQALERLRLVPLPTPGDSDGFSRLFKENKIDDVVNCAGAVHYFDVARLRESNVDLVHNLLAAAKEVEVRRFVHVSTAFSCGYIDGEVREELHTDPASDPTEYTRFKRRAEWLIVESGIPYLILRPSIVIGDSRNGRYFGPPYGVYQLWWSFAKVLMTRYRRTLHVVATDRRVPLVHEDAFAGALLAARERLPSNSIVNVVSDPDMLPTVEDLWRLWSDRVARPHELRFYKALSDLPLKNLDPRYKTWLNFTAVNSEISMRGWQFETRNRDKLIRDGLTFPNVSIETILQCQRRFVSSSEIIRNYHEKFELEFPLLRTLEGARSFSQAGLSHRTQAYPISLVENQSVGNSFTVSQILPPDFSLATRTSERPSHPGALQPDADACN